MQSIAAHFYQLSINPFFKQEAKDYYMLKVGTDLHKQHQFHTEFKKHLAQLKPISYLITFTLSDDKLKAKNLNINNPDHLRLAKNHIIKKFDNKQLHSILIKADWVREGNEQDKKRPHWHWAVTTKTYIKAQWFATYTKYFGTVDIKLLKNHDEKQRLNYFIKNKPKNTIHKYI